MQDVIHSSLSGQIVTKYEPFIQIDIKNDNVLLQHNGAFLTLWYLFANQTHSLVLLRPRVLCSLSKKIDRKRCINFSEFNKTQIALICNWRCYLKVTRQLCGFSKQMKPISLLKRHVATLHFNENQL